jgi:hypothetical protein
VSKFDSFVKATGRPTKTPAKGKLTDGTRTSGRAKRDDPDFKQALAYVRRDTHRRVMATLAAKDREFSDLVEELLTEWLKANS